MTADDFDGDGLVDLAIGDVDYVQVQSGRGNGQFDPPELTPLSVPVDSRVTALASDDIDGDGVRDLIVASGSYSPGTGKVTVLAPSNGLEG